MRVGILGSGEVARTLGAGFLAHGHEVTLGTRDRAKLDDWAAAHPSGAVGSFADAAAFGDVLVLAVKGGVAADVLELAGHENLAGKPVLDTTNPIADAPPENGVLRYFTSLDESLMERLQRQVPARPLREVLQLGGQRPHGGPRLRRPPADDVHLRRRRGRQGHPRARSSTSSAGRPPTWAAWSPPAPSSPSASSGASRGSSATSGPTPSPCCARRAPAACPRGARRRTRPAARWSAAPPTPAGRWSRGPRARRRGRRARGPCR